MASIAFLTLYSPPRFLSRLVTATAFRWISSLHSYRFSQLKQEYSNSHRPLIDLNLDSNEILSISFNLQSARPRQVANSSPY